MFSAVLLFLNIGGPEMILIVFVALLLFGGEKLPQIARGLGKGIRDFKDASEGVKREITNQINSYEEKRTEEVVTDSAHAEIPNELPPATDEHVASANSEEEHHDYNAPNPITETYGVPNTMPYVEDAEHGLASNDHAHKDHEEASEGKTEPIKTAHE
jgi:sec-independent protein translocase protein TatA